MSTLKADTIQSTGGGAVTLTKQAAAKVFIWFDGNTTNAIENSLNISSSTDSATGEYVHSLTAAMSTTKSPSVGMSYRTGTQSVCGASGESLNDTSSMPTHMRNSSGSTSDSELGAAMFGDLA